MAKYKPSEEHAKRKTLENEKAARDLLQEIYESFHTNPAAVAEMFAFASNFYTYSPKNTQLIYQQNPYATYCQSYAAWKKDNAPVMKGQHGLLIWVRVKTTLLEVEDGRYVKLSEATKEQKEAYNRSDINSIEKISYKIGHTFDISQTTFPKERYPELYSMGFSSEEHRLIYQGICDFSDHTLGCPVEQSFIPSISLRGCYSPVENRITLNNKLEDTQLLSTCSHELGHALIHKDMPNISTAQKELEADALSIMLESTFGIQITDARKRHFSSHYSVFVDEIRNQDSDAVKHAISEEEADQIIKEQVEKAVNKVFDDVFNVYRGHIDEIQKCVDKYLPQENHILKEKALMDVSESKSISENKLPLTVKRGNANDNSSALQRALTRRSLEAGRFNDVGFGKKGIDL